MNKLAKVALAIAIFLGIQAAQADSLITLTAPTTSFVGQVNRITAIFQYTPVDLAPYEAADWQVDYRLTDADLLGNVGISSGQNSYEYLTSFHVFGYANLPWSAGVTFDSSIPLTLSYSFDWIATTPGEYQLWSNLFEYSHAYRSRSAECFADENCKNTPTLDDGVMFYFFNGLNATIYVSEVSAVPEQETYAMMLAGLGVIGAVVRRKTKRKD